MKTFTMFIGEMLCFPIFLIMKYKNRQQYRKKQEKAAKQGKKLGMNKFYLAIPAFCDFLTSGLKFIALNYVSTSAYQMTSGGNIITCFFFSIILLKIQIKKPQLLGTVFALFGILIVGLANILFTDQSPSSAPTSLQFLGYFLLILALFTSGLLYTFQQKLLSQYHLEPLEVVGYEGIFGLIISGIAVSVLNFVPCHFGKDACVFRENGQGYMEGIYPFFQQLGNSFWLIFFNFAWIVNIFFYNPLGVSITKHINGLARAISDVSQTIVVWAFGIIVTLGLGSQYPNFMWEKMDLFVILIQIQGFVLLVVGNLIYNQLIWLPFLNKKQKQQYQNLDQITEENQKNTLGNQ